ncbi:hypothetical protein ANN_02441 [Periplaneta americana]|uniref:Uncharacterized protein n=1 Tax=Periplaneta americana TaxID=6978 RepID=A0ABQ8U0K2_PERAM|nr:hypothetical protein ANN_02441 [Periplaneta americana]
MSPGCSTESYPAFARIGLRENPGKNLNQVTWPNRDSNPGQLVSRPDALTVTAQVSTVCVNDVDMSSSSSQVLGRVACYGLKLEFSVHLFFGRPRDLLPCGWSGLSANDDSGYNCSANVMSAFYRYKTASSYGLARSMWTSVPRKKSILSRLRTSHNIRDIAPGLLDICIIPQHFSISSSFHNIPRTLAVDARKEGVGLGTKAVACMKLGFYSVVNRNYCYSVLYDNQFANDFNISMIFDTFLDYKEFREYIDCNVCVVHSSMWVSAVRYKLRSVNVNTYKRDRLRINIQRSY